MSRFLNLDKGTRLAAVLAGLFLGEIAYSQHTLNVQAYNQQGNTLPNAQVILQTPSGTLKGTTDNNGTATDTVNIDVTTTGVEKTANEIPNKFELMQNYPNPFNPTTSICYNLVKVGNLDKVNVSVSLRVYDVLGREVAVLVNEEKPAEEYRVVFNASYLPSGIYFYRLSAGNYIDVKKMILMK